MPTYEAKTKGVTFSLTAKDIEMVTECAEWLRTSKSDAVRTAVRMLYFQTINGRGK